MNFLTIPAEIRCRIYSYTFLDVCVTKISDPNQKTQSSNGNNTSVTEASAQDLAAVEDTDSTAAAAAAERRANLSILLVCRKCYAEAHSIFWATATFHVRTMQQHRLYTDPSMLPHLADIRQLALDCSLLTEWTPTLLRLVMRSLVIVTVLNIAAPLGHAEMVRVEQRTNTLARSGGTDYSQIDQAPSLVLFRSLMVALDEAKSNRIMAHFEACHDKYTLRLEFRIQCRHIGQLVVPGAFPMAGTPHRHDECTVTYTFNA